MRALLPVLLYKLGAACYALLELTPEETRRHAALYELCNSIFFASLRWQRRLGADQPWGPPIESEGKQ